MSTRQYETNEVAWLQPDTIDDSPFQPAQRFLTEDEQREFDASIKAHGVLQPGLVRPIKGKKARGIEYQCVFGHLRRDACARLDKLFPCFVRPIGDTEAALLTLSENVDRKAISDYQEA